ncbi:TreTu family toxin [Clostridium sp. Marseille-P2415]|uniref:TreTu family toxin n=1 Tax=Clostridium sp. Marseille-P2415 TaxID=1805471 RepID=UPI003FA4D2C6
MIFLIQYEYLPFVAYLSTPPEGAGDTRVGRWMSQAEYDKMVETGRIQMSGDNKVHVANPADIEAFGKQAPKGSLYVEFDVSSNTISPGGTDGWGIINGPGSLLDRLNAKKGLPRITEMPQVTNIEIKGSK